MIKNQQNSVTKKDPHVGKKNFYYFFGLVVRKSFPNSKCLLTSIQDIVIEVKNIKKI